MNSLILLFSLILFQGTNAGDTPEQVDNLINRSKTFWYNNRDSAITYLDKALSLATQIRYAKGEADALKGLGFLSFSNSEQLNYYVRALEIRRQINDSVGIGASLHDIGTVYQQLGDTSKMMEYYHESYSIRKKIGDEGGIALCLTTFGQIDESGNHFREALAKFMEALHYRMLSGEINGVAFAHVNIANVLLQLQRYDSAKYYAKLAEKEFQSANNRVDLSWATWVQARCLFRERQTEAALSLLKNRRERSGEFQIQILLLMSDIYESLGRYKESLDYRKEWIAANAEKETAKAKIAARKMAADYEFKIKQEEARQIEHEQLVAKRRRDNLQFLVIAVLLLAVFVCIILLRKKAPPRILDGSLFLAFLFLFEFLIVLIDPALQPLGGNTPLFMLLGNAAIALTIAPLHHAADKYFKRMIGRPAVV